MSDSRLFLALAAVAVAAADAGAAAGTAGAQGEASPEARAAAQKLEGTHCRKTPCCASEIWPAGRDRRGRQLAVVALGTNTSCLLPQKPAKRGSTGDESDAHACADYWLIDVGAPKRPAIAELGKQCAGDHSEIGAAMDARQMAFGYGYESVYSPSQSSEWTTIGLDPVRLVAVKHTATSGEGERTETWSSDEFAGDLELGLFSCKGKHPADAGESDVPDLETRALKIPRPTLPEDFLAEGWKTTGLGRCAARIGGDRGFTIHGSKGTAADASMRVVFSSPGDMFVELTDDRFVTGGKSWVKDDHLELWTAAPPSGACVDPSAKSPALQWGIGVTDGRLFPGFGAPTAAPKVEVARVNDKTVRLRITIDPATLAGLRLTLVYSDSDDGAHQERLIATSQLVYGKWWTLGEAPDNEGPTCAVVRGALEPKNPGLPGL